MPTAWPAWADRAVYSGEPNVYFDADREVSNLSQSQREALPSLIQLAESRMVGGPMNESHRFVDMLLAVACRVQPGIGDTAASAWAASLVQSLSRIPTDLLSEAVYEVGYRQFRFLNEVGPFIEDHVAEPLRIRRIKKNRLSELYRVAKSLDEIKR